MTEALPPELAAGATDRTDVVQSESDLPAMIVLEDQHGPLRLPVVAALQCLHILVENGLAPPIPEEWFGRTPPERFRTSARTLSTEEMTDAY